MASIKHLVDLDLNKNQLLNAVVQNLAVAPTSPNQGQIYWDTAQDSLFVWDADGSAWIDLGSSGITNLDYTAGTSNGVVTSSTGTDATIPLADGTNAGLFSATQKTKLDGIQAGAQADQNASEVVSSASGNLTSTNVQSALQELQGDIDSLGSETNNLSKDQTNGSEIDIDIENGTGITIDAATTSVAGVMTAADKTKLDGIESNAKDDQTASQVVSTASGNLTSTNVQDALEELQGSIDSTDANVATNTTNISTNATDIATNAGAIAALDTNVSTNITIVENATNVSVNSSDGTDDVIDAVSGTKAGVMLPAQKTKLDGIAAGAQVNVDDVVTSLALSSNILTYTDEDGTDTDLDLSLYLDDSNLSRLTSGTLNGTTGLATFTRSDASTFTIDMSAFLDAITLNNTLTSTSTTEGLTAAQGKVLKDLIDGLNVGTGTNTGDETSATLSNEGIAFLASQAEVNAGSNTTKIITPSRLRSTLGITASLTTTLTFSGTIGNGTLTSIPVTHSIGNQFVQASVYDVSTTDKVECEIELTSASVTTFKFNVAPTSNQYRVVITG